MKQPLVELSIKIEEAFTHIDKFSTFCLGMILMTVVFTIIVPTNADNQALIDEIAIMKAEAREEMHLANIRTVRAESVEAITHEKVKAVQAYQTHVIDKSQAFMKLISANDKYNLSLIELQQRKVEIEGVRQELDLKREEMEFKLDYMTRDKEIKLLQAPK